MHLKSFILALTISTIGNQHTAFSMDDNSVDDDNLYRLKRLRSALSSKGESLILKIEPIDLPKTTSRSGKTLKMLFDPSEITIILANGQSYSCGSKGEEIDISSFAPEGNKYWGQFSAQIHDRTRSSLPGAKSYIHSNGHKQKLPRCKFSISSDVTNPMVKITYDENARKFFASGLWPKSRN